MGRDNVPVPVWSRVAPRHPAQSCGRLACDEVLLSVSGRVRSGVCLRKGRIYALSHQDKL